MQKRREQEIMGWRAKNDFFIRNICVPRALIKKEFCILYFKSLDLENSRMVVTRDLGREENGELVFDGYRV